MTLSPRAGALALALACCAPATAQAGYPDLDTQAPANIIPATADAPLRRSVTLAAGGGPVNVNGAMLVGRSLVATCTAAGTVTLVHSDGSTVTVAVQPGTSYWPEATREIASATATCTYWNEW